MDGVTCRTGSGDACLLWVEDFWPLLFAIEVAWCTWYFQVMRKGAVEVGRRKGCGVAAGECVRSFRKSHLTLLSCLASACSCHTCQPHRQWGTGASAGPYPAARPADRPQRLRRGMQASCPQQLWDLEPTGYITCRAQCKLEMQGLLFKIRI